MKRNRREFFEATTLFGVATALGALDSNAFSQTSPANGALDGAASANGSDTPNDPNAIVDADAEIGKPYRGWREGELDLHFIHTGVGESCFQIYPDGTTALVDAGDRNSARYPDNVPLKPNATRRAGEWVARHVARLLPGLETIDYVVVSHFHTDHCGCPNNGAGKTTGRGDDYQLSGIAHVGEFFRFGQAFDRGYPNYDAPTSRAPNERENLRKFFNYKEKTDGLKREPFRVGALDQIALKNAPEKYDFHLRNVCANGVLWNGEGDGTTDYMARCEENLKIFTENTVSLATTISFGPFKFYSGGDVSGPMRDANGEPFDYEGAVGRAVGPVDVCKSNHHSYKDAMTPGFVQAVQARVYVTCVWDRWHLQDNTATTMTDETLYPGPRLICPTTIHPENAELMRDKPWRKSLVERTGTVVVKAFDGGKKYKVYYLSVEDEKMTVDAVYGPFDSKGARS